MVVAEFRQEEIEPREQSDYKEEYQRVGECKEEPRNEVLPRAFRRGVGCFERQGRSFLEKVESEGTEHNRPHNLEQQLIVGDEIGDKRHAQTGEERICQVRQRRADTGEECRHAPFVERTLDDEHPYRPHRG